MPMVATFYNHEKRTVPLFVVLIPHDTGHFFVKPMELGWNGDVPQATDKKPPGAVATMGAGGPTSVVMASIV